MTCSQPSTTPGILVAYGAADTGARPLDPSIPYWESPNIRLALQTDIPALKDPAKWDMAPFAGWNGQVVVGSTYNLLVRIRNTDAEQRASLNFQGWVSDYTHGGVGPGSQIYADPTQPAGMQGAPVTFTEFDLTDLLGVANPENPADPASMLVLVSEETWTPNAKQITVNGGHVCVAVNVWAEAGTAGDASTPADGQSLTSSFLDPTCDRRYGQRNIQIVLVPSGHIVQIHTMLLVPLTDRCPLHALTGIRRVELNVEKPAPELVNAARHQGIKQLLPPQGDPLAGVQIGYAGSSPGSQATISLQPGQRENLTVTLNAQKQRPGAAYAFDVMSTDTATKRQFGAARVFVLVTD